MENEYLPHVLNEQNKFITKKAIEAILAKYGVKHKVKNLDQFQNAMIHESYLKDFLSNLNEKTTKLLKEVPPISDPEKAIPLQDQSYEVLEFLGDAVIHHVLATYLFKRYYQSSGEDQGFLTKLRTKIEKGDTLGILGRTVGLSEYAIFARNIELQGGRVNNVKIMEDMFEAFIGALSLEAPYETCETFVTNIIDKEIDMAELINTEDNYKEMLMQHCHKLGLKDKLTNGKYTPKYKQVEVIDEQPRRKFKMCVLDNNGDVVGVGIGTSKKSGEQNAAFFALVKYGVLANVQGDKSQSNDTQNKNVSDNDDMYFGEVSELRVKKNHKNEQSKVQDKNCNHKKNKNESDTDDEVYGYLD